jgi:hypothetical protein
MLPVKTKKKAVRVKPVGVSEIKDKRILAEAVAQVHRKPTAEDWAYVRAIQKELEAVMQ